MEDSSFPCNLPNATNQYLGLSILVGDSTASRLGIFLPKFLGLVIGSVEPIRSFFEMNELSVTVLQHLSLHPMPSYN
jgi:hypothetical protein